MEAVSLQTEGQLARVIREPGASKARSGHGLRLAWQGELTFYLLAACAISWGLWLPRIATVQGWWTVDVPEWWHYVGAAGPVSAAVVVSAVTQGNAGLKQLFRHYSLSRIQLPWVAFSVFVPLLLTA